MKLSAPIHQLKRKARQFARDHAVPHHDALDYVARQEGYGAWSLLAVKYACLTPSEKLLSRLIQGDLVLVGARPGQGKTLMTLGLVIEAMKSGRQAWFFTLEYTPKDVLDRFRILGAEPDLFEGLFTLDCSDAICADYIVARLATTSPGAIVVVDYLQLLDQRRESALLATQIRALRDLARERAVTIVVISQIARSYDPASKPLPDMHDIRLPNPLDLALFTKACFLHEGRMRVHEIR